MKQLDYIQISDKSRKAFCAFRKMHKDTGFIPSESLFLAGYNAATADAVATIVGAELEPMPQHNICPAIPPQGAEIINALAGRPAVPRS